jgi:double-stranded uracil-DNA glycosylase
MPGREGSCSSEERTAVTSHSGLHAQAAVPVTPVNSLPPIAHASARLLILGSMPGTASLAAGRYYAHPRNLFWPIMGALFDAGPEHPYDVRAARLQAAGVAVWDVLASCIRPGSLDAAIDRATARPNDFIDFFAAHPRVVRVYFNGIMAEHSFRRLVLPTLPRVPPLQRLPSTSPAHAARTFEEKLAAWRVVAEAFE